MKLEITDDLLPPFRPLARVNGYLPLEDHGLIGDGASAALVGRDGGINWLCVPHFDSPPLFCGLLDAARGGAFRVGPAGAAEGRQAYLPDTGVLVTEVRGSGGVVRLTDAMTFRTKAEREVERRERVEESLREADRRKDEILAVVAHEIRGPLSAVSNSVQLLRRGIAPTDAARAVQVIERQARLLGRLADDLLDVTRVRQGKLDVGAEAVDLADALALAIETIRPQIDARRHGLAVALPSGPALVEGDLARLTQVFANLLANSAKYTPEGGSVSLEAVVAGSEVVVRVRDDGAGISADMLARVFEPFAQAGDAGRRRDGLGIGLSLVKSLVHLHGGTVEARSEGLGKGSEFVVRLPLAPASAVAGPAAACGEGRPASGARLRVLVADDKRDCADSLAMLLSSLGDEVRTAYGGEEAVKAAEEFRPDVVLLDLSMPGVGGHEACRRIRREEWGRSVLLVAQTGWGQEEERRRAAEAGFDRHLVKPVDPDALAELLAEARATKE